jgi:hypothetical protein
LRRFAEIDAVAAREPADEAVLDPGIAGLGQPADEPGQGVLGQQVLR